MKVCIYCSFPNAKNDKGLFKFQKSFLSHVEFLIIPVFLLMQHRQEKGPVFFCKVLSYVPFPMQEKSAGKTNFW